MVGNIKLYFSNDRVKTLLLLLLVGFIYLPFLSNPLVFDDTIFFKSPITYFTNANFDFTFRWFPYTTFGVTWAFFGEAPEVFRIQNLLLHGMNVLLLLLVLRRWIALFVTDSAQQKMANWGAWLGALVFACHPLAVYGTGYLMQRSILMATLFTFVMHLAYFRGLLEGDKRYAALAVAAYFLAVFSKEHSIMAPALLLLLTWVLRERIKLSRPALIATWIGFAVVGLMVLLRAKGVLGQVYEMDAEKLIGQEEMLQGMPMLHLLSVLTQAGLYFKYCLLMIIPNSAWMSIDMRETFILSWREWTSWLGLFAFISYGIFAWLCLLRRGRVALLGVALLYPWLFFLTEFSTIRIQEMFVLYRSYLWLPGFMLLLPLIFGAMSERKIMLAGAVAALLLVPLSWNRLWIMADNYRLWDEAVQLLHGEDRLGAARIYYGRAYFAETDKKDWSRAIEDYKKSLQITSAFPPVRLALARVYAKAGRNQEAFAELDRSIAAYPEYADAYYAKALMLNGLHDNKGATILLQKSCDLGKDMACMLLKMGENRKQ
jgi:tetratricopeptide (TPR) repeat protein